MECPVSCVILLLLCTTILPAAVGLEVVGGSVVGVVGEDLVLPCFLKPPTSAVGMEVTWFRGMDVLVHRRYKEDKLDLQDSDYRDRTSLFGLQELQRGNASLKITSVKPSDIDKYTCQIQGQTSDLRWFSSVQVEAVGSTPVITTESRNNGSVDLQCESTGWTYEPQVEWRDSRGQSLSAEPTTFQRFPEGYRVVRRVRVERSDGTSFTCRVWTQRQAKEEKITVPESGFKRPSQGMTTGNILGITIPLAVILIIGIAVTIIISWRRKWRCWDGVRSRNSGGNNNGNTCPQGQAESQPMTSQQ